METTTKKEVKQTMTTTQKVNLVVGAGLLKETIERFMQDDGPVAVYLRDQRRDQNAFLRVERLLSPREATLCGPMDDLWLRLRVVDYGPIERDLLGGPGQPGQLVRTTHEEMLRRLR